MARKTKRSTPDVLDDFESLGDRLVAWAQAHSTLVITAAALCLVTAGAYGAYTSWRGSRELDASGALDAARTAYRDATGTLPGAGALPELANPEAGRRIQDEFIERFRAVADEHAGTTAGAFARLDVANLLASRGDREEALEALHRALDEAPSNPGLRAILLERTAQVHEAAEQWAEAGAAYQSAGEIESFALRYWALADAARCYARAGESDRALALFDRLETEAPQLNLPAYLRSLKRELRSGSNG